MAKQAELLIDVSRLVWRVSTGRLPTGIDRVCLAYIAHYRHRAQAVVQWKSLRRILSPEASSKLFDLLLSDTFDFRAKAALLALRSSLQLLRSQPGRERLYLNIGHTGLDRPGLSAWIARARVRPVFMVHDLIPITHPSYCRDGETARHKKRIGLMLDTAVGIVGNSQATLDVLAEYAESRGLPVPSLLAAWLGTTPLPAPRFPSPEPQKPLYVTLGTIEGRKNHVLLLKVWQALIAKLGAATPQLVIIGQRGWENDEAVAILDTDASLRDHVVELPRCKDSELAHYLHIARALLFPSFAEGYGMPLVEALTQGTPVIASNLEVFRELAGDIPDYLDPTNAAAWQTVIEAYSPDDSPARSAQLKRMGGYSAPTWTEHFAKVDSWLETLPTIR